MIPLQELNPARTNIIYRVDLPEPGSGGEGGSIEVQNSISPTVNLSTVDRNLKTPFQDEFTFSIERELWAETSVSLTYINRKFQDQIQDININLDTGDFGRCVLQRQPNGETLRASPGVGEVRDDFTGEIYFDDDPGDGDGILDDCLGETETLNVAGDGDDGTGGKGDIPDNTVNFLVRPDTSRPPTRYPVRAFSR